MTDSSMRPIPKGRVFSRDKVENSTPIGGVVVIDAIFPPTYTKSSMGISLNEQEKRERVSMLNLWIGALLSKYHACTNEARDLIAKFLNMEEDNPAEPQNKWIMLM